MIKRKDYEEYKRRTAQMLRDANIVITDAEVKEIEIADFGLSRFEEMGLAILVYINTDRVCAKDLMMLPNQNCVEHRHPEVDGQPGKEETFRCRWGKVYLYVPGDKTESPKGNPPADKVGCYTCWHEIELNPGDQYLMMPDTPHWFQAGPEGAVISEFSSKSRDELDVFTDQDVKRSTEIID